MDVLKIISNASGEYMNPAIGNNLSKEIDRTKSMTDEEKQKLKVYLEDKRVGSLEGYNCDICRNKGFIMNYNNSVTTCKCMKIRETYAQLRRSGLYEKVKSLTFKNYTVTDEWQKKCLEVCLDYCKNKENWLFLGGQSGCGKTHLCTAIFGYLVKQGITVKYMSWRDDITELKQVITDSDMYQRKIMPLKTTELLYIDDFFKTEVGKQPTQSDINLAYELLNFRYNNKLMTIISSELTTGDIINIDEAIAGRILEMSQGKGHCLDIQKDRSKNYRLKECIVI